MNNCYKLCLLTLMAALLLLFSSANSSAQSLHEIFTKSEVVSSDLALEDFTQKNETLNHQLNLGNYGTYNVVLEQTQIFHTNYKGSNIPLTFKGYLENTPNSTVTLTVNDNFLSGSIHTPDSEILFEPYRYFDTQAAQNDIIIYDKNDVISSEATCLHKHIEQDETYKNAIQNGNLKSVVNDCTTYEAQIFLVADYSMYQEYGSEQAVIDRMTAVLNEVQSRYDDEFNAPITFTVVDTYVSDCDTCDPWLDTLNVSPLLASFRTWGNDQTTALPFDVASFWTRRDLEGTDGNSAVAGFASTGTVCGDFAYNINEDSDALANSRNVQVHELGHNFGASHDASGGDIMSPSGGNGTTWSQTSQNAINTYIESDDGACLCQSGYGCADPFAHNYDPDIQQTLDDTCETCNDGIQNGPETAVDVGPTCLSDIGPFGSCTVTGDLCRRLLLQNYGAVVNSTNGRVGLYLSEDPDITTSDYLVGSKLFGGVNLNPNSWSIINICGNADNLPPGTYYVGAIIDYQNVIPELDETNNLACTGTTYTIGGTPGCTDATACNYDPNATDDDGSCIDCNTAGETTTQACNDGDPCTLNDQETILNCDGIVCVPCTGTFADADNDTVCDANDVCPNFDDTLIGTACDDNDVCTTNDIYTSNCECKGTFQDADNDTVCDANDVCPTGDDNIDLNENGTPDACEGDACPPINFQDNPPISYGGGQDNGTVNVSNPGDVIWLENNAWKAIPLNYTVTPNTVVSFDFKSTIQGEIHGIGFDTNSSISSNYTFRVYGTQSWGNGNYDNYNGSGDYTSYIIPVGNFYTGQFQYFFFVTDHDASPRNGNSYFKDVRIYEDLDGDLLCDADCNVGAPCNDGDDCTTNDVYNSNCECAGIFSDIDNDGVCDAEDLCFEFDDNLFGTPCNDNNDCTINDVYVYNNVTCACEGTLQDTDNDGVCDADDVCPNFDDNLIGTACDDGDACTENDIYISNCECAGVGIDSCLPDLQLYLGDNVSCQTATDIFGVAFHFFNIVNEGLAPSLASEIGLYISADQNFDNQDILMATLAIPPLAPGEVFDVDMSGDIVAAAPGPGAYYDFTIIDHLNVVNESDEDNNFACIGAGYTVAGAGCTDQNACNYDPDAIEDDGSCIDCTADVDNIVAQPCDDGDSCTLNDLETVLLCNGFVCVPCAGTYSDEDGDGICDTFDNCPDFDDNLIGEACDDGNSCTINDQYINTCECAGAPLGDTDGDGVCDGEDICEGGDDNLDNDNDGIPDYCDDSTCVTIDEIGDPCDDKNDCTENDVFVSYCVCLGTPINDTDGDSVCDEDDPCPEDFSDTCDLPYCATGGTNTNYEFIQSFKLNSAFNDSGNDGGYGDYTGTSFAAVGNWYCTFEMTPGFSGSTYAEEWAIWIDYNKDGDFDDANEEIFRGTTSGAETLSTTLYLEPGPGYYTRMRVAMRWNASPEPCGTYQYGEVEDYTVFFTNVSDKLAVESSIIQVFPNPADSYVSVDLQDIISNGNVQSVQTMIYTMDGKQVYAEELDATGILTINTQHLPEASYILRLLTDDGRTFTGKFVKL